MSSTNITRQPFLRSIVAVAIVAGCGGTDTGSPDAAPADALTMCIPGAPALTYTQLYTRYFAPGTPGHCATDACHGEVSPITWTCGSTKDTCYGGMVGIGLIDTTMPLASKLGDSGRSPLQWISDNGPMPADDVRKFPEGRDAILAWIRACAPNN